MALGENLHCLHPHWTLGSLVWIGVTIYFHLFSRLGAPIGQAPGPIHLQTSMPIFSMVPGTQKMFNKLEGNKIWQQERSWLKDDSIQA